jgi:hypothetical protein
MQNADNSDLCAEMLGIGSYFQGSGRTGPEQQLIELFGVGQGQHVEFVWHGEDDVEVAGRKKLLFALGDPAFPCLRLALGAVPVTAGNGDHPITCLMGSNS